jgi:hypothetical protein
VLLPRTATVRAVLWRPRQRTTVFDAKAGSNAEPCKALAKEKPAEATTALVSSLAKS